MDLNRHTNYILEHPKFKNAVYRYVLDDTEDLKQIVSDIQIECMDKVIGACLKTYKMHKRELYPDIIDAISNIEPPDTLMIKLSIPELRLKVEKSTVDELHKLYAKEVKEIPKKIIQPPVVKLDKNTTCVLRYKHGGEETGTVTKIDLKSTKAHILIFNGYRILRFRFKSSHVNTASAYRSALKGSWMKGLIVDPKPNSICFLTFK